MSGESSNTSSGGNGFLGLLAIVFITLKLLNIIDWSWWWVTAPLWGGIAFFGIVAICLLLAVAIVNMFKFISRRK